MPELTTFIDVRRLLSGVVLLTFALLTSLQMISSDCFLDGVTYAATSRNLAQGTGTFWQLCFTSDSHGSFQPFYEHPPFALWLESLVFKAVGDHSCVEQLWGVVLGMLTLGSIALFWRIVCRELDRSGRSSWGALPGGWWPLLLFVLSPLVPWCYTNNLLENTLSPLIMLGSAAALASCVARDRLLSIMLMSAAGGGLFLALLTKGPPALFPTVLPLFSLVFLRNISFRRVTLLYLVLLGTMGLLCWLTWALGRNDVSAFLDYYINKQMYNSVNGLKELASSRYFLVTVLLQELAIPLVVCALLWLITQRRKIAPVPNQARWSLFLLALALSGSLPFLAFPKQMTWYVMPSLQFYALALALRTRTAALVVEEFLLRVVVSWRGFPGVVLIIFCILITVATGFRGHSRVSIGTSLRDAARQFFLNQGVDDRQSEYTWSAFSRDVLDTGVTIPPGSQVLACPRELHDAFRIDSYLQRYYRSNLTSLQGATFQLVGYGAGPCYLASNYQPMTPLGKDYTMYKRLF
jgi:hypothetical protein